MEKLPDFVELVLVFVGVFLIMPPLVLIVQVFRMSKPESLIQRDDRLRLKFQAMLTPDTFLWMEGQRLVFKGCYKMDSISIQVMEFPDRTASFLIYRLPGGIHFEIASSFPYDGGLDTTNMRSTNFFPPRPGQFKEALKLKTCEEVFQAHQASLALLRDRAGIVPVPEVMEDFQVRICESLKGEMKFVRSLALWPLRSWYWYYIRQNTMFGISLTEQVRRRMVRL